MEAAGGSRPCAPEPPKLEAVPGSSDSLRVSWTSVVSDPPVLRYSVLMRKVDATSGWQYFDASSGKLVDSGGSAVRPGSAKDCVVSGLEAGAKYVAKFRAANVHGFGAFSGMSTLGKLHIFA